MTYELQQDIILCQLVVNLICGAMLTHLSLARWRLERAVGALQLRIRMAKEALAGEYLEGVADVLPNRVFQAERALNMKSRWPVPLTLLALASAGCSGAPFKEAPGEDPRVALSDGFDVTELGTVEPSPAAPDASRADGGTVRDEPEPEPDPSPPPEADAGAPEPRGSDAAVDIPAPLPCGPLPGRELWSAQASSWAPIVDPTGPTGEVGHAIDGNLQTRWTTGKAMAPGDWYALDMGAMAVVSELRFSTSEVGGHAVSWEAYGDGELLASGVGSFEVLASFEPVMVRELRIEQTGQSSGWWSIHELTPECN